MFIFRSSDNHYLYLFRISYMYTIVIGFFITFIVALIISAIIHEPDCNNPDLFTPFVAKRLIKQQLKNNRAKMVKFFITYFTF